MVSGAWLLGDLGLHPWTMSSCERSRKRRQHLRQEAYRLLRGRGPSSLNHVTALGWKELHERLFLNMYSNQVRFKENRYKGSDFDMVKAQWDKTRLWFRQNATVRFPSQLLLSPHFQQFDYLDAAAWGWIAHQERITAQVWHTKQGVFRRKVLADVRDDPMRGQ